MKRRIKSLLLAVSLVAGMVSFAGCGKEKETTTEPWEKEHQMEEETAYYKKDTRYSYYTGEEELSAWIIYEYDDSDNMFKRTEYNELGEKGGVQINEYDEEGRPLTTSSYNKEGSLYYIYEYQYDDANNTETMFWSTGDEKELYVTIYKTYDEEGKLIEEKTVNADETIKEHSKFIYDGGAKPSQEERFDNEGELIETVEYTYDDHDNQIMKKNHDLVEGYYFTSDYSYEYDEKDNIISKKWVDANGLALIETIYEYNEEGKVTKETSYNQGEISSYVLIQYIDVTE